MSIRQGEKWGWIGGWLGSFLWLLLLSGVCLYQGRLMVGLLGASFFVVAVATIFLAAPWRHPATPYWKLLIPVYGVFTASGGLAVATAGGLGQSGLSPWSLTFLVVLFVPLFTVGKRTWNVRR